MIAALQKLLIESLVYPLMERFRRNRVRQYFAALKKSEALPPDALLALQRSRLQALLLDCVQHVPAYRACGLTETEITSDPFAALRRLPVLEKTTLQQHPEQYLNEACDPAARIANVTGGSSGQPLHFFMDRPQVEQYEAARWRGLSWWGISFGSRCAMLWGNPIELQKNEQLRVRLRERLLKNRVILSAYQLSSAACARYVRFLNRYQPEYLYGYAGALAAFAALIEENGLQLRLHALKVVVSTSETMTDAQRAQVEAVFGVPVAYEYGARDAGILAFTCPEGTLHLASENAVFELLDPITLQPVRPGERGLLAVTDLCGRTMPRLRYLLGDTAVFSSAACSCGRTLPALARLDGREEALFLLPDGTLVHGNIICQLARRYTSIAQYQLIQTDVHNVVLQLVQTQPDACALTALYSELCRALPGVHIRVKLTRRIAPLPSGKTPYAMRLFPLPRKCALTRRQTGDF